MPSTNEHITDPNCDSSVELDWYDGNETIRVTPRDQDRFEISKDQAIDVLQINEEHRILFGKQFNLLLSELADWIDDHIASIKVAYVTMRDASFLFVVVKRDPLFDLEFEDHLSDLDFRLANDTALDLVSINTMSLPPTSADSLQSFFHDKVRMVYRVPNGE